MWNISLKKIDDIWHTTKKVCEISFRSTVWHVVDKIYFFKLGVFLFKLKLQLDNSYFHKYSFLAKKKTPKPPAYPIACHFFIFIFFVNLYAVIVIDKQVDHNLKEHIIFSVLIIYFKIFLSYCFCCHQVN